MHFTNTISLLSPIILLLASTGSVSAVSAPELGILSRRQAPGTPKFECHSNCGNAIKLSKASTGDDACKDSALQTAYTVCTACAEREGIWQYYGPSLSKLSSCNWGSEAPKSDATTSAGQNTTTTTTTHSNSTGPGSAVNSTRPSSTPTPTQAAGDSAAAMNSVSALVGLGAIVVGVTVMAL